MTSNYYCLYKWLFNRTYCDEYETVQNMFDPSLVLMVTSDMYSKRMEVEFLEFDSQLDTSGKVYDYILDETQIYQEILGFGGAFTDSGAFHK